MSDPSKTTILFVPGAWHGPEWFAEVESILQSSGYKTDHLHLASVGPKVHLENAQPDIDIIAKHLDQAIDAGQKVVLVMHSYGSVPAMDAVYSRDYATRKAAGKEGGVTHLVFMAAFVIPAGASLIAAFGGNPLPWFDISEDGKEVNPIDPAKIFYNDLEPEQVDKCVKSLKPFSYSCHHSALKHDTWSTISGTYIRGEKDNAVPPFVVDLMLNDIAGAKGVKLRQESLDSGHSPFLSKPQETADAIKRAAEIAV